MLRDRDMESLFDGRVKVRARPGGVLQAYIPVFYEDGDMVSVYVEEVRDDSAPHLLLSDRGSTLMHLSYEYEIDTENKRRIFHEIVEENGLEEREGRLLLSTSPERLAEDAVHFASTAAKVATMRYFSRAAVSSLFLELFDGFVMEQLSEFMPRKHVAPIVGRDELLVDYVLDLAGATPVFLFAVNNVDRARLATINLLEFKNAQLPFRSFVIHDDLNRLPKREQRLVTNAADKQFYSFEDFAAEALPVLQREQRLSAAAS